MKKRIGIFTLLLLLCVGFNITQTMTVKADDMRIYSVKKTKSKGIEYGSAIHMSMGKDGMAVSDTVILELTRDKYSDYEFRITDIEIDKEGIWGNTGVFSVDEWSTRQNYELYADKCGTYKVDYKIQIRKVNSKKYKTIKLSTKVYVTKYSDPVKKITYAGKKIKSISKKQKIYEVKNQSGKIHIEMNKKYKLRKIYVPKHTWGEYQDKYSSGGKYGVFVKNGEKIYLNNKANGNYSYIHEDKEESEFPYNQIEINYNREYARTLVDVTYLDEYTGAKITETYQFLVKTGR